MKIEGTLYKKIVNEVYHVSDSADKSFRRQKTIINYGNEIISLEVPKSKIKLIEQCSYNQLIEFEFNIQVLTYKKDGNLISCNRFIFQNLEILRATKYSKQAILLDDKKYVVRCISSSTHSLNIELLDIETDVLEKITENYQFPDSKINSTHAFIKKDINKDLLVALSLNNVISIGSYIKGNEGVEGYVCKFLVSQFLNSSGFLPVNDPFLFSYKFSKYNYKILLVDDTVDYSCYRDDIDMDEQSDKFWNQF